MKLAALALAALFCASPLAQAVPITDWRTDDLMMQAAEARKELGLHENQNLLWEQSVRKTRAILRTRKERRELVDATARKAAVDPAAGLRQLAAPLDEDAALSQIEDRQLRETWLTLNDALDDRQRAVVLGRVRSMLETAERPVAAPLISARMGAGPGPLGRRRGLPAYRPAASCAARRQVRHRRIRTTHSHHGPLLRDVNGGPGRRA